ncbi:flagellin [Cytobacillus firmus]|uniref:flagellin Hag n=1 Tax=Cytobacillus firmus TaxID=1399 RepID=UPI0018CFB65A|nr:flagellin Hag [Cytobacillus firmus]MBG9544724.1 flagellin [Cytobacillus firmus]MBG9553997.1 flagellin [Cytobacillus firmus]MBG9576986.1 flagellin [Cytobacillus firmus]MED4448702.1 flagellin Hag [Cytobacillus firmus]
MRINHNIAALNTYRQLNGANAGQMKSMEKLSSGLRINRAGDDAAGLAISEKMRGQIRGLDQASRNAQDGISLIQTAEGALNETHSILQRMRELAVQSSNDTNNSNDRTALQNEMDQLAKEVNRIANNTQFNTKDLLKGDFASSSLDFQIGANQGQTISLTISNMAAGSLGVGSANTEAATGLDISSASASFDDAISKIDAAIQSVSNERSKFGSYQNRLEHTINNLGTSSENLTAAESRIRDVDMAKEMMSQTKNSILSQAAQAMLAQANQQPQGVLQLLR